MSAIFLRSVDTVLIHLRTDGVYTFRLTSSGASTSCTSRHFFLSLLLFLLLFKVVPVVCCHHTSGTNLYRLPLFFFFFFVKRSTRGMLSSYQWYQLIPASNCYGYAQPPKRDGSLAMFPDVL